MEILCKQAANIAPRPHDSVAVAWSPSLPPAMTTAVTGSSSSGGQCQKPRLLLPKVSIMTKCHAFVLAVKRDQTLCSSSSSVGSGLARVYSQQVPFSRRGRELARAEWRGDVSGISVQVGSCREGVELVCRVMQIIKCRRRRRPAATMSSVYSDISSGEGNLDLELEVLRFMHQSNKPDEFPTRQDLITAGRRDLAMAIAHEGGWLAAGWDEDQTSSSELSGESFGNAGKGGAAALQENGSSNKSSARKLKALSVKSSSIARKPSLNAKGGVEKMTHLIEGRLNGTNVVREVFNALDHNDGRKKYNERTVLDGDNESHEAFSRLEGVSHPDEGNTAASERKPSRTPSDDDLQVLERLENLLSFTDELKLKRPLKGYTWGQDSARNDVLNGRIETTRPSELLNENSFQNETKSEGPAENSALDAKDTTADAGASPRRKRGPRKKGRGRAVKPESIDELNGTSYWTRQLSDSREKSIFATSSKCVTDLFEESLLVDLKSTANCFHTAATKLADMRAAMQSLSEDSWKTGNADDEERRRALAFVEAEDTLEFRENAIISARNELNTTRAQAAALEGTLKVEIMEARKILEEKNREIELTKSIYQRLRSARIVWPNLANEVYLTGSFNGWNSQVKMEKSSAGVFTCSLRLYPGRYEIKFVVDGSWRVDTGRPIVYVGGCENNVLSVT